MSDTLERHDPVNELWEAHGPWCDHCGAPILEGRTEFIRNLRALLEIANADGQAFEELQDLLTAGEFDNALHALDAYRIKRLASLDAAGGAEWKTTVGGQEHSYETNRDPDSAGGAER